MRKPVFRFEICVLGPMQADTAHKIAIRRFRLPAIETLEMNARGQGVQMTRYDFSTVKQKGAEAESRENGAADSNGGRCGQGRRPKISGRKAGDRI